MKVSRIILTFSLFVLMGQFALAQNMSAPMSDIEQGIKEVEIRINANEWGEEDKDRFSEIKALIFNELAADVDLYLRSVDETFFDKLSQVVGLKDLYQWDAEGARLVKLERLLKKIQSIDTIAAISITSECAEFIEDTTAIYLLRMKRRYLYGINKESIEGPGYKLHRTIFNSEKETVVFEKRVWDWGGEFHFKNGNISITKELYELGMKYYEEKYSNL